MAEDQILPIPNLDLPQALFVLSNPKLAHLHEKAREDLLEGVRKDEMGPWYKNITSLTSSSSLPTSPVSPSPSSPTFTSSHPTSTTIPLELDSALLKELEEKNKAELTKLDERLEEAKKQEGETEISEALKARANYLTRIGDKDLALPAQLLALEKTPGLGSRIDITLTIVRIGFFFGDHKVITEYLDKAEKLIDEGGDWDRRNRLKVYTALHLISIRQFRRAADLFLDATSTFTAVELVSLRDLVAYGVIAGTLTLSRGDVKKRIISSPEVNQIIPELPVLADLYKNLYESHYDKFFKALATLEQTLLLPSRILSPHTKFYLREMRILAYTQLLESYRSLTLESLSRAFGVGVEFVDRDLSHYISTNRIHARIDKVHGVVETTRPSRKAAQYERVVKVGDELLGSVGRLSKVLH